MANGVNGSVPQWLLKQGAFAVFAGLACWVIYSTIIVPFAAAQKGVAEDRKILLKATTESLDTNAQSMKVMSKAVVTLDETLSGIRSDQADNFEHLKEFTKSVSECHEQQTTLLKSINEKVK